VQALGSYYERTGQYDKARTEFAALSAKYPKNLNVQESTSGFCFRSRLSNARNEIAFDEEDGKDRRCWL